PRGALLRRRRAAEDDDVHGLSDTRFDRHTQDRRRTHRDAVYVYGRGDQGHGRGRSDRPGPGDSRCTGRRADPARPRLCDGASAHVGARSPTCEGSAGVDRGVRMTRTIDAQFHWHPPELCELHMGRREYPRAHRVADGYLYEVSEQETWSY